MLLTRWPMGQVQIVLVSVKPAQDWGGMSRCSLSSVTHSVYSHVFPQGWPGLQVLSLVLKHIGSNKKQQPFGYFSFEEGSPWSASEPSIEPEVLSNTGMEENYHRNMSWLHVSTGCQQCSQGSIFNRKTFVWQ